MNSLRTLFINMLTLLLAMVGWTTANAQVAQDALYIFRNDGKFNAFFFDDIQRFAYSKVDTLGVEHDDYVVQEVYALDSVFRIPVSAIDSIAFVTPETVYKSDVIKANPLISNYVVASDSASWIRLSASVPTSLLPKKGDKWLIEENSSPLLPGGFGGRVTSVENSGGGYTVTTEPLQPDEAFERAMLKIAVGTKDQANTRNRGTLLWGSEEPIELEPRGATVGLTGSKDIINNFDITSLSVTPLGSISYYIEPTLHARSFLSVDPQAGVHIDGYIGADAYIEYGGKVSGTLTTRLDLPFPHKLAYFRKVLGEENTPLYAKVLWKCGIFAEAAGSLELESFYSGTYHTMASVNYYRQGGLSLDLGQVSGDADIYVDTDEYELKKFTLGGSFTGGLMLEAALECYNPLICGVSGVGLRLELGRMLSFKIPVTTISDDLPLTYYTDHTYDVLNIDDIVSYSPFVFANPYLSMHGWQTNWFNRTKYFELNAGIVPKISDYTVKAEGQIGDYYYGETTASYKMGRNLLLPVDVGFTVLDWKDDVYATYKRPDYYWNFLSGKTVEYTFSLDPLKGKTTSYTVFPTVHIPSKPPILCSEVEIVVDSAYFSILDYDDIELPVQEGTLKMDELDVATNCPKVAVSTGVDWVTASWMPQNRVLVLHYKALPEKLEGRECMLHVIGKNSKDEVLIVKDYTVRQGKLVIEFSPDPIEAEAEGGTYTAKIIKSPLKELEVKPGDSFLHPTLVGDVVTVVVDPNPDLEEREGNVIFSGITERGQRGEATLKVHQKASPFTVSPDPLEVPGYSSEFQNGVLKRQLTVSYPTTAKELRLISSNESWLTVDNGGGVGSGSNSCNVTIKPNTNMKEPREAKITVELTKADGKKDTKTVLVKQSALTLDVQLVPSEVTLKAEESAGSEYSDRQTVQIKITPWDDFVASLIKSQEVKPAIEWIKALRDGTTITVYGEANPVNEDRTNYVTYTLTPVSGDPIVRTLEVTQKALNAEGGLCDDYTPKPIYLGGEVESQVTVTYNCPNVDHITNIHCLNDSWLGGSSSGMVVLLTAVNANTTGQMRQGSFELTFLMKDGTTAKRIYTVYQNVPEDPSVPHVTPTSLNFSAKGGMQSVQAYVGSQYNRVGYTISNDGKDWISVVNYDDYHLEITAKPNTTGDERTCTVTVYMASFEGNEPTPGTETKPFPITITQAGGGIAVNSCVISATAMMQESTTGASAMTTYGESFASPDISVTLKGTSLHVVATKNYQKDYDVYQNIIEFDITAIGNDFANSKVENLQFRHIYKDTYVDWTSPGVYGKGDDVALQLTNLRWQKSKSNYTPGAKSTFVFSGTVADGVKFSKLTQTKVNYTEDKPKQVFNYVENQGNSAELVIELTIDPNALSGMSASRQAPVIDSSGAITW